VTQASLVHVRTGMGDRRIERTATDEERIEQLADADGDAARTIDMDVRIRSWLGGTVSSVTQTQVLDDELTPGAENPPRLPPDR